MKTSTLRLWIVCVVLPFVLVSSLTACSFLGQKYAPVSEDGKVLLDADGKPVVHTMGEVLLGAALTYIGVRGVGGLARKYIPGKAGEVVGAVLGGSGIKPHQPNPPPPGGYTP